MELLYELGIALVGWPGIITALVLVVIGIYTKKPWLVTLGALFSIPISWYLGSMPMFDFLTYAVPIFLIASAFSLKYRKQTLAWLFTLPYIVMIVWLGLKVISQ